jgi:hypothetical protein
MKKFYFYGMVIVCLFCTSSIFAQDRFWIRAAGNPGNWNDVANWSATSGGAGGASVPNGATFNAFFNQGATVNVNGSFPVNRVVVSGATLVRLLATSAASTVTVSSTSVTPGSEAFRIETGATLEVGCTAAFPFDFTFANNTRGVVNGIWDFTGTAGITPPNGATFVIPTVTGFTNQLDIFGTVRFGNNTRNPSPLNGGPAYLFFRSGSTYHLNRNGGSSPPANWDANSTILVTGITNLVPTFNVGATPEICHLNFNCAGITAPDGSIELSLNGLIIQGNLSVLNTTNLPLTLLTGLASAAATVEGNLNISGTSVVYIGEDEDWSYDLSVGGNLNLSGGSFLMQLANGVGTNTTVLSLQGNLNHTGGTFGVTSNSQSTTTDLFVVELNGSGAQTISSTGVIDNANNMLTLRMNNAAGASLLTPVSVGKISWNSANKGILTTTTTNVLTVRNPDATNATVINLPANNGYVSGPLRRMTNSTGTYQFPTGKSGFLRYVDVIPSSTTASTYAAEYFRTAYSDLSVINPLTAVSNVEYWEISRVGAGATAQIRLNLAAALAGAGAGDGVVVARYSAPDWVSVKGAIGTALTPGNSSSGFVLSDELSMATMNPYTLAYGPAGALPIDLVSFTAKKLNSSAALLNWEVTASSTPDRFEVLRSTDGNNFTNIGTVQGVDQKLKYDFTDNNLPSVTTYYRLRMIDKDGDVKLSAVVAVTNGTDGLFLAQMAPTVVIDRARITVTSPTRGNLQMVVTDMQGRIVKQQINGIDVGSQPIWLNLQSLASGAYQLTGYLDGKRSASIRFIKQ